jgi:gliding motility-associated lipoprotein GldH
MKQWSLILITLAVITSACNRQKPVSKVHTFSNAVWERFNFVSFDFEITDINRDYDVYLIIRYNDDFLGRNLPVNLTMTTPSGGERIRDFSFFLRNAEGQITGEDKNGIYELVTLTHPGVFFSQPGTCHFELENFSSKYFTTGIVEVGIVLEPKPRQS